MKKQSLLILLIILAGSSASIVYATGTVITNTGITTGDLTVTGTCSGCGGSGSFTSYATLLNQTITGTNGWQGTFMQIGTDGSIIAQDFEPRTIQIKNNGAVVQTALTTNTAKILLNKPIVQTPDGKYTASLNETTNTIDVFKNHSLIQKLGIKMSQFSVVGLDTTDFAFAISSDGKYITLFSADTTGAIDRFIVFEGS